MTVFVQQPEVYKIEKATNKEFWIRILIGSVLIRLLDPDLDPGVQRSLKFLTLTFLYNSCRFSKIGTESNNGRRYLSN